MEKMAVMIEYENDGLMGLILWDWIRSRFLTCL